MRFMDGARRGQWWPGEGEEGGGGEEREERTLLFVRARLLDMADALCLRAQSISL